MANDPPRSPRSRLRDMLMPGRADDNDAQKRPDPLATRDRTTLEVMLAVWGNYLKATEDPGRADWDPGAQMRGAGFAIKEEDTIRGSFIDGIREMSMRLRSPHAEIRAANCLVALGSRDADLDNFEALKALRTHDADRTRAGLAALSAELWISPKDDALSVFASRTNPREMGFNGLRLGRGNSASTLCMSARLDLDDRDAADAVRATFVTPALGRRFRNDLSTDMSASLHVERLNDMTTVVADRSQSGRGRFSEHLWLVINPDTPARLPNVAMFSNIESVNM